MYLAGHELVIINGHINKLLHSRTQLDEVSLSKSQTTKVKKTEILWSGCFRYWLVY